MAITINAAAQDLGGDAIVGTLPTGTLRIYSAASAPANAKGVEGTAIAEGTTSAFGSHSGDAGADMSATTELTGLAAAGSGTDADHFRFLGEGATGTVVQGTVTGTGGGGDLELDNINIAENQAVNVTAYNFTLPDGT